MAGRWSFAVNALSFAIGSALLMISVASVVLGAAFIVDPPSHFNYYSYMYWTTISSGLGAFLGTLLMFVGWKREKAETFVGTAQ